MRSAPNNDTNWSQRLSGADSVFLSIENKQCPMNMGILLLLEAGEENALVERIRAVVREDGPLPMKMRSKLAFAPLNLAPPRWVPDPHFDIDTHIFRHDLSTADSPVALQDLIEEIASTHLPLDKPLWQVHLVSQAPYKNQTALILKMHHCLADGISGMLIVQELMDHNALRRRTTSASGRAADDGNQDHGHTIADNFRQRLRLLLQLGLASLMQIVLHLRFSYLMLVKRRLRPETYTAPRTRFNHPISGKRSYAFGTLALAELREIQKGLSCNRNEAFLAMIASALRAYLEKHNELPPTSLYAGIPLTLSGSEQRLSADNQLTFYRSSLATRTADPQQRLARIQQRLNRAANITRKKWRTRLLERLIHLPPRNVQSLARLYRYFLGKGLLAPNFNLFTTLLPGTGKKASICGRKVTGIHPISIPYHGVGLAITAIRYHDQLQLGIIADRRQVPDTDLLVELMQKASGDLLKQARSRNNGATSH